MSADTAKPNAREVTIDFEGGERVTIHVSAFTDGTRFLVTQTRDGVEKVVVDDTLKPLPAEGLH